MTKDSGHGESTRQWSTASAQDRTLGIIARFPYVIGFSLRHPETAGDAGSAGRGLNHLPDVNFRVAGAWRWYGARSAVARPRSAPPRRTDTPSPRGRAGKDRSRAAWRARGGPSAMPCRNRRHGAPPRATARVVSTLSTSSRTRGRITAG